MAADSITRQSSLPFMVIFSPNKSLHPTPGSGYSSAAQFTSVGPALLSSGR